MWLITREWNLSNGCYHSINLVACLMRLSIPLLSYSLFSFYSSLTSALMPFGNSAIFKHKETCKLLLIDITRTVCVWSVAINPGEFYCRASSVSPAVECNSFRYKPVNRKSDFETRKFKEGKKPFVLFQLDTKQAVAKSWNTSRQKMRQKQHFDQKSHLQHSTKHF